MEVQYVGGPGVMTAGIFCPSRTYLYYHKGRMALLRELYCYAPGPTATNYKIRILGTVPRGG